MCFNVFTLFVHICFVGGFCHDCVDVHLLSNAYLLCQRFHAGLCKFHVGV